MLSLLIPFEFYNARNMEYLWFIFHTLKCLKIIKLPHLNNAGTEFVKHKVRYNGNLIVSQYYIDARTGKAIYTRAHILL
jgi:hypothetical protein